MSLSSQTKKHSVGPVTVFWDYKCLNYGQNWERSFFQALTSARVVVLLVSKEVRGGRRGGEGMGGEGRGGEG